MVKMVECRNLRSSSFLLLSLPSRKKCLLDSRSAAQQAGTKVQLFSSPRGGANCGSQQSAGSMQRPSAQRSLALQGSPRPHRPSPSSAPSGQSGTPSQRYLSQMQWRGEDGHWKKLGPQKLEEAAKARRDFCFKLAEQGMILFLVRMRMT